MELNFFIYKDQKVWVRMEAKLSSNNTFGLGHRIKKNRQGKRNDIQVNSIFHRDEAWIFPSSAFSGFLPSGAFITFPTNIIIVNLCKFATIYQKANILEQFNRM